MKASCLHKVRNVLFTWWPDASQEYFLLGVVGHLDDECVSVDHFHDCGGELLVFGRDDGSVAYVISPDTEPGFFRGFFSSP